MQKRLKTLLLVLISALSASLSAAPIGFSVNSDSPSDLSDGLYRIDLATGSTLNRIGTVQSQLLQRRIDVEGLAFAPDGTLYGIDDDSLKLFAISQVNGLVDPDKDYDLSNLSNGNNDFGMTFACDENLYVTSVVDQSLYRVEADGDMILVGGPGKGKLAANISALAAYGFPVQLYGLGNGTVGENAPSTPKLYLIDTITGTATEVGPLSGNFGPYESGGLAFDDAGDLWAMTDRRQLNLPSQVMRIDKTNGSVADPDIKDIVANTAEEAWGFESLAITGPGGCTSSGNGQIARFYVQSGFTDGNNVSPVTLNFKCDGGTVFTGTRTLFPTEYHNGIYEASFSVDNVPNNSISCEVWEDAPTGYTPQYSCQSETSCTTNEGAGPCIFSGVAAGQQDVCLIDNNVTPVEVKVTKEWENNLTEEQVEEQIEDDDAVEQMARVSLYCAGVYDGDGEEFKDYMRWSWEFEGNPDSNVAMVYPAYDESTTCWTEEPRVPSAVESESTCTVPIEVKVGDDTQECIVTNTIFFEGIPTLSEFGMMLAAFLMLLTGMAATRRLG